MYDAIRLKSPPSGARLTKLRAERRLTQHLILGWGLAAIWNLVLLIGRFSADRLWLQLALVVGVLAAWAFRRYMSAIYALSLEHHWQILEMERESWFVSFSGDQS